MKWKQQWNLEQVIQQTWDTLRTDLWGTHTGGCSQKQLLHTQIFRQNPHKNIQSTNSSNTYIYNALQVRQWYLHLQCSWQYKMCRNDQLQYCWSGVLMSLRWEANGNVLREKSTNSKCRRIILQLQVLKQKLKDFRATKLQEGWQHSLSCITV